MPESLPVVTGWGLPPHLGTSCGLLAGVGRGARGPAGFTGGSVLRHLGVTFGGPSPHPRAWGLLLVTGLCPPPHPGARRGTLKGVCCYPQGPAGGRQQGWAEAPSFLQVVASVGEPKCPGAHRRSPAGDCCHAKRPAEGHWHSCAEAPVVLPGFTGGRLLPCLRARRGSQAQVRQGA